MTISRSENMRRIRSEDSAPEMAVRRLVYKLGYRYKLHRKGLPGRPDLVFTARRKVIFVHGCFWHQHQSCREGRPPKSRRDYWLPKLERNVERDRKTLEALSSAGWESLVIWECETKDQGATATRIVAFLGAPRHRNDIPLWIA